MHLLPVALMRANSDNFRSDSLDLHMARVLIAGFDPGLSRTGWGVIAAEGSKLSHVANGIITTVASQSLGERLAILHAGICTILHEHAPHAVAVEQAFVAKDPLAALKLGHA